MYLLTKFQVSNIILMSSRQGVILHHSPYCKTNPLQDQPDYRQGNYCSYLALRVKKIFFFLFIIWTAGFRKPYNHIFLKTWLPSYRWSHTSRSLKIFFPENSSNNISIHSFFLADWFLMNNLTLKIYGTDATEKNVRYYYWVQKIIKILF